jgi:hypothetical protein
VISPVQLLIAGRLHCRDRARLSEVVVPVYTLVAGHASPVYRNIIKYITITITISHLIGNMQYNMTFADMTI